MDALTNFFLALLKISLTAGITAGIILLVRPLAAKKLPRRAIYALWAIVLLRLMLPFSLPSPTSIYTPTNYTPQQPISTGRFRPEPSAPALPEISAPAPAAPPQNSELNLIPESPAPVLIPAPPPAGTEKPTIWNILAFLWLSGTVLLLTGGIGAYLLTLRKYRYAHLLSDQSLAMQANALLRCPMRHPVRLYVSSEAESPLVAGIFHPRIILPEENLPERETLCVVLHEFVHIRRGDHLMRLLSLLLLSLHWFNPLLWLAYRCSARDMELSCDEAALSRLDEGMETNYAKALLAISVRQRRLVPLLMFGESNLKTRVKNVLSYKKASFWVILTAAIVLAVGAALLLTDPIREPKLAVGDEITANLAGVPLHVTADEQIVSLLNETGWSALEVPPETEESAAVTVELDNRTLAFSVRDAAVRVMEGEKASGYIVPPGTGEALGTALLENSEEYTALPAAQRSLLADLVRAGHLYGIPDSGPYFAVSPEYAASVAQVLLTPGREVPLPASVPGGSFTLCCVFPQGIVPLSFFDGGENTLLVSGQQAVSLPVPHAELLAAAVQQPVLEEPQPYGMTQIVGDFLVRWDGNALTVTDLASGELLRRTEREGITVFSIRPGTLPGYAIEVAGISAAEGAFVWSLSPADDGADEFYTTFYSGSYDLEDLCGLTASGNYAALYARADAGPNLSPDFTVISGVRSDTPHHEERSIYIDSRTVKQRFSEAGRFWEDFTGLTDLSLSNSGNTVAANLGAAGYPSRNGFFLAAWDGEQWQQRWIIGTANIDTLLNSFYRILEDGTIACCVLRTNGWTAELIDPDTLETVRTLDFGGYSPDYLTLEGQASEGNTVHSPRLDVRFCDRDTIAVLDFGFRLKSPRLYLYDLAGNQLSEPFDAAGSPIAVSGSWFAVQSGNKADAYPLSALRETLAVRPLPAAPEKEPLPPEPETDPVLMAIANNPPSLEQRGTALSFWTGWIESGNPFADPTLWELIEQANLTGLLPEYTGTGLQYEIEGYAAMNLYRADERTVMELLPVDPEADPLCYRASNEVMDALDTAAAELADSIYDLPHSPDREISDFVNRNRLDIIDLACRETGLPRCYDYQYYILEGLSLRGESLLLEFNYRGEWDYIANKALAGLAQPDARSVELDGRTLYETENTRLFVFAAGNSPALVSLEDAYVQGLADGAMLDEARNLLADKYPRLYRDDTSFRVEQILNHVISSDPETGTPAPTYDLLSYYRFQDLLAEFRTSDEWASWEETLRAYLAEQEDDYSGDFNYALQLFYPGDLIRAAMRDARGDTAEFAEPSNMLLYDEAADIYRFGDGFGFSYTYRRYPVSFTEEGDILTVTYATLLTGGDSGGERPCVRIDGEYIWLGESWRREPTLDEVQARAGELPTEAFSTVLFVRENGRWVLP